MFNAKLFNHFLVNLWLVFLLSSHPLQAASKQHILDKIKLPKGFTISLFADNVPNARAMALGRNGTVFVGSRNNGNVYALQDTNNDGKFEIVNSNLIKTGKPCKGRLLNYFFLLCGTTTVAELEVELPESSVAFK